MPFHCNYTPLWAFRFSRNAVSLPEIVANCPPVVSATRTNNYPVRAFGYDLNNAWMSSRSGWRKKKKRGCPDRVQFSSGTALCLKINRAPGYRACACWTKHTCPCWCWPQDSWTPPRMRTASMSSARKANEQQCSGRSSPRRVVLDCLNVALAAWFAFCALSSCSATTTDLRRPFFFRNFFANVLIFVHFRCDKTTKRRRMDAFRRHLCSLIRVLTLLLWWRKHTSVFTSEKKNNNLCRYFSALDPVGR